MSEYTQVFVVPRGTRDRIIKRFVSYRQGGLRSFYEHEPTMFAKSVQNGGLFVPDYDPDRNVWVTTPMRWFEIILAYRKEMDKFSLSDDSEPVHADDCMYWLQQQYNLNLYDLVITEET